MFGAIAAFGFVLALLGATLKILQRYAPGAARIGGKKGLRMEVVQRLAIGPKQGIAVVRVGERLLAVSMGEGGVRLIQELDGVQAEIATVEEAAEPMLLPGLPQLRSPRAFGALVRQALRNAAVILLAVGAMSAAGAGSAEAQVAAGIARQPIQAQATAQAPSMPTAAQVDAKLPELAPQIDVRVGQGAGGLRLSGTVGVVVMMGLMTLLPTLLLMMTGFTRILVVLHFLRQALGTQSAPPGQLMAALALLLTGFVMAPTLSRVNETALQPWMNGTIDQAEMLATGVQPFREFMFAQVRESDVTTFLQMSSRPQVATVDEVPLVVLMSAFVTSELRTAFQIGFALFLPFIVIDVVVAAVLMSMGMMMLPPAMISLPFKILLFVLVDGWALIAQGLVTSFR
jgi:flagellar biosynthetic protein FliP